MNDHGLFWDATACAFLEMPISEQSKEMYDGPLMEKVMQECGSVDSAKEVFQNFYCDDLYRAQYLLGDSTGASMIVEGDDIVDGSAAFQVMTNFYHSHPELGGYPCWRYNTAVSMLEDNAVSTYLFGSILAATHQEGRYPTQYSAVYDLRRLVVYLFYYHNFEEFITVDLSNELSKGYAEYDLPTLFSSMTPLSPAPGDTVSPAVVTFSWRGKPSSQYNLYYSTEPEFLGCEVCPVNVAARSKSAAAFSGLGLAGFALIAITVRNRRRVCLAVLALVISALCGLRCGNDATRPSDNDLEVFERNVENLRENTSYYWKVVATPGQNADFSSETLVQSFFTST
jgi:hypothetical protein